MSSATNYLLSIEEFLQLADNEHLELVRGEVARIVTPGGIHGAVAASIGTLLHMWAKKNADGAVGISSGFILAKNPDIVSGPDVSPYVSPYVSYVSAARLIEDNESNAFWTVHPDLAVEVVSPSETAEDVQGKVLDFLAAGTPLVWVVYPRTRQLVAYTPDGVARTYANYDQLEFSDVLPGFSCKVSELFE